MAWIKSLSAHRARLLRVGFSLAAAAAVAGCGLSDGVGALLVDPARYSGLQCKELIGASKTLANREKELRNLINKANEGGGGGTIVGAVAYRGDYETVLEQQKVLQRAAAERKCELVPTYRSDQTIR